MRATFSIFCLAIVAIIQGEKSCPKDSQALLIIGGMLARSGDVMSLDGEPLTCDPVPDLPVDFPEWGTFLRHKNKLVFCEGVYDYSCWKYSPKAKVWKHFGYLPTERVGSAQMDFGDYFLVTGGISSSGISSDFWNPKQGEFQPGPDLPLAAAHHCIAVINQTHALMTAHDTTNWEQVAFMYDRRTERWTRMESLKMQRFGHACGLVGKSKVVVAGGHGSGQHMHSVEVFDLKTEKWTFGKELPFAVTDATSVQLEDTFLIVGGNSDSLGLLDTIIEYDECKGWILWEQPMTKTRSLKPAVYQIPEDYFNCAA